MTLSEEECERLAKTDPTALIAAMRAESASALLLTFGAEHLGDNCDSDEAVAMLLDLTRHVLAVVREGAIYGLSKHACRHNVADRLQEMSELDASAAVRGIARNTLARSREVAR